MRIARLTFLREAANNSPGMQQYVRSNREHALSAREKREGRNEARPRRKEEERAGAGKIAKNGGEGVHWTTGEVLSEDRRGWSVRSR